MNQIIISQSNWEQLQKYLLQDHSEHLAFLYANNYSINKTTTFLVKELVLIPDNALDSNSWSLSLTTEKLLEVINKAKLENLSLIEAHSHPFSKDNVSFSRTDMNGFKEFVPYVQSSLEKPYAALVLGTDSINGFCWKNTQNEPIDKITILGEKYNIISLSSKSVKRDWNYFKKLKRQTIFSKSNQPVIKNSKVAIVGAGGIGSHVIQQLTYLGVRDFILIDFDKVEETNLNRLIGASPLDIGKYKIDISSRLIRFICSDEIVNIQKFPCKLNDKLVLDALTNTDFIFGCIDNDGARVLLNEFSRSFHKPYFDCGVGINHINDKQLEIGGRIIFVRPDSPCLQCAREIDNDEASYFLQSKQERETNEKFGYVQNFLVPSPSVVTLNGTVASIATTEFFLYVLGQKRPFYVSYDANSQKTTTRLVKKDESCFACSLSGLGVTAEISNRFQERTF